MDAEADPVDSPAARVRPRWLRWLMLAAGVASLALAALGVGLPLLPTTPLVLLAAFLFVRSSESAHRWLLRQRVFGQIVREWQQKRRIPARAKWTAIALVFRGLYGDVWIEELLTNLPGGRLGLLVVANLTIFVLGFFIDFFEIAFIILPLLVPAARLLGIDLVWFGVMVAMNLQTSFLTPPFGFSLFYLRGVTPEEVPTTAIYRGVLPFIAIQVIALGLVIAFPGLVTWLLTRRS